jgi:RimJ/RimL family protein N-acetyltransferase
MEVGNEFLLQGLSTQRLQFRLLEPGDFNTCLLFFEHPLSHQYWPTEGKTPLALCTEWFDKQRWRYVNNKGGARALIHPETGTFLGWCGLLVQEVDGVTELEVGYSIMPEQWGNGYATEAARACLDAAFEKDLAASIISIIQVNNMPSRRVAEKNGMRIDRETTYHGNPVYIYRAAPK